MKTKWVNFYTRIAAGTVLTGSLVAANKIAKKYGEKPNSGKMYNINPVTVVDYGIKRFLETDDEKLVKVVDLINNFKK